MSTKKKEYTVEVYYTDYISKEFYNIVEYRIQKCSEYIVELILHDKRGNIHHVNINNAFWYTISCEL